MPRGAARGRAPRASSRDAVAAWDAERAATHAAARESAPGVPRDVLADFAAFARFDRNGLAADISFAAPGGAAWSPALADALFAATERNMRGHYERAAGWGWDAAAKRAELVDSETRALVARVRGTPAGTGAAEGAGAAAAATTAPGDILGFVTFRFLREDALDVLYVYELQLAEAAQRKGLGRHLMQICELVARKQGMHA